MFEAASSAYSVFGLVLSSNVGIPGLTSIKHPKCADISVHFGLAPDRGAELPPWAEELFYVSSYRSPAGDSALRIWRVRDGAYLRLEYYDGVQFWIEQGGEAVWASWSNTSSFEDAVSYLLGPVLGIVLRLRGITCLHSSAVVMNGYAVALVGAEGAGKSTAAAALAGHGCSVLSDDIVAVLEHHGCFYVPPAYPHLCLWPDSVERLYGSVDFLPRLLPHWEKRRLHLGSGGSGFQECTVPLGAIYVFGRRSANSAPYVESLGRPATLLSLAANTFATKILDADMRAREFQSLSRLESAIPVRRLCLQQDTPKADEVYAVIREDLDLLTASLRPQ